MTPLLARGRDRLETSYYPVIITLKDILLLAKINVQVSLLARGRDRLETLGSPLVPIFSSESPTR